MAEIKPTSQIVRGLKQGIKQFGSSRDEILRAVQAHLVQSSAYNNGDLHDEYLVPIANILDQLMLKKGQAPERGPSLAIPAVQDGRTYLRRSAYAGQSQYDSNAPVNLDNDVKFVNNDDHQKIDNLNSARNILTDHPNLKNPDPELAADVQQKLEKVNTDLAKFEKAYGIKFATPYPQAGQEMDAFAHASSTDPVWQRHLRSKGIHLYQAESKTFDRFNAMSLSEQLALLAKVDKKKIDKLYESTVNEISDEKKREIEYELRNEKPNNYAVHINGRKWKVVADRRRAEKMAQTLISKGKDAKVYTTGEPVSEADEPKDASARAKLDLNLRDRGHKVEKPKKGKGSFKRTDKHKGKLPEATDFRKGDRVKHAGTGEKGTVLHKGNRDQIFVKFGSLNKSLPAGQLRLVDDIEEADQVKTKERKPKTVKPNKGHQSKHPYQGRLVGEGAVPETDFVQEYKQIMSKPLLGSDLMSQMRAFEIVPDPAMIKEFRNQISMAGRDTDLRSVFKSFANAKLHPAQKKKVGLGEAIVGNPSPASVPEYLAVVNDMLSNNQPLAVGEQGDFSFLPSPDQQVNALLDLITGYGENHLGKTVEQIVVKNLHKGTIRNAIGSGSGSNEQQEKIAFNRGEQAEAYHALAAFVRFIARPTRDITLDEVVKWIPKVKNGVIKVVKVKDAENKQLADEFNVTIALKPDQWNAFQRPDLVLQDRQMEKIAQNVIDDANSETGRRADRYATNGRYDIVRIIGDGVSGETETKTDIEFENEVEKKYRGYSIKAGTVKQVHQVGGGAISGKKAVSPEERWNIIAKELFGVHGREQIADISSAKEEYLQVCNNNSVECRLAGQKLAYNAATESFNEKLSSNAKEKSFIKSFSRALKYFQARDDDTILLKQFTGTKAGTYILDPKRLDKLHKLGFDLVATYNEDNKSLPYIDIIDKDTGDNLVRFRTYMDGKGYIRNYIEKGELWKKVTNIAKSK